MIYKMRLNYIYIFTKKRYIIVYTSVYQYVYTKQIKKNYSKYFI